MAVGRGETILVTVAALVVVVALAAAIAWQAGMFGGQGRAGPQLSALGQRWETTILDGGEAHNSFAIGVRLHAAEGTQAGSLEMDAPMWRALCDAVMAKAEAFVPPGVRASGIDHVDLNLAIGGQRALNQDLTVFVQDGACADSLSFNRLDYAEQIFSTHSKAQHVAALIESWGLRQGGLTYRTHNGDRSIDVAYKLQPNFARDPGSVSLLALCRLTLANINKETRILVLKVNPANYPRMKISLPRKAAPGVIALKDGKCVGAA